jgi:transposase
MWALSRNLEVFIYRHPVDMRKSFDGLSALAKHTLKEDPLGSALFVFVNRRRTQMRCLYFDGDGYCVWAKRLEHGCFQVQWDEPHKVRVDMSTLRLLAEGISPQYVKRFRRYSHPVQARVLV